MQVELFNSLEMAGSLLEDVARELGAAVELAEGADRLSINVMAGHVQCLLNAIDDRLGRAKAEELALAGGVQAPEGWRIVS